MRKIVPALLAAACGSALAQHQVQLYGRLNVGLESLQNDGARLARLSNNRSVLGFRGEEDVGGGVTVLFQIEGTLAPDTGAGSPAARDTRVGIAGPAGTLFAGNWVTPYNGATAGLDPFYPTTAGYMSIMGNGAAATASNTSDTASFDRRQQNSVHYWTPVWNGWQLRVAQGVGEERPANGARPSLSSGALVYQQGAWYASAAWERHHDYQGPGLNDSAARLGAAYRWGDTRVALVAERLRYATMAGTLDRNDIYAALTRQLGRHAIKLGLGHAGDGSGSAPDGATVGYARKGAHTGATHATVGYDYTLSQRSAVYAYYSQLANRRNGVADFAINSLGARPGATLKGVALGLRHNF
ncbi:porin [Duganella radicis]|uniref:Porin n=2 Tax=Duganella radicis TaxID=551988 RepID=A0A6L6PEY5_9BURK|nr:porin [Duganella radicis]